MDRKVVWSAPAVADLDAIAAYVAQDSEHYAASFIQEVLESVESLSNHAERGQIVPEFHDSAIRELLVQPFASSTN